MNRRKFLAMLGVGASAAAVAAKIGLIENARKYFFAPYGGWGPSASVEAVDLPAIALRLQLAISQIAKEMSRDGLLFDRIGRGAQIFP